MHLEIEVVVNFLTSFLQNKIARCEVDMFGRELGNELRRIFKDHWHPDMPSRGSGYRCVL